MRETLESLKIGFVQELRIGRYSIDFAITNKKIAIEVDGNYWHRNPKKDQRKDVFLVSKGWRVLRFNQTEVEDTALRILVISRIAG